MTRLGPDVLREPTRATTHEWLLGDGRGGWAASTAVGINTRRSHGLLVVPVGPDETPFVLLARLEEALVLGGRRFDLSTGAYPGTLHPRGFEHLASFSATPLPTWQWELPGARLTRTLARLPEEPVLALTYLLEGPTAARLELRPMLAYRAADALQHENAVFRTDAHAEAGDLLFDPYGGCPALRLRVPGSSWDPSGYWYRRCEYARDVEAGREGHEDQWSPGVASVDLRPGSPLGVLASAAPIAPRAEAVSLLEHEKQRLRTLRAGASDPLGALRRAADAFLVRRADGRADLAAGYLELAEGWRERLRALPGVAFETRRLAEARALLVRLADEWPPERARSGETDIALRGVLLAARGLQWAERGDALQRRLLPWCLTTLEAHLDGRVPGVALHPATGLLADPDESCAIDVQALWFNALLAGAELQREAGDERRAAHLTTAAARVRESVLRLFWCPEKRYLADAWSPNGGADQRLRARQIAALALPHALLPREKAAPLLEHLGAELLTPVGLRTLGPSEPGYLGRDDPASSPEEGRGSAWPALACAYFDALLRVSGEEGKRAARAWLHAFEPRLGEAAAGFAPACFDGDPPHAPRPPLASAAAVGELLRLTVRLGPLRR